MNSLPAVGTNHLPPIDNRTPETSSSLLSSASTTANVAAPVIAKVPSPHQKAKRWKREKSELIALLKKIKSSPVFGAKEHQRILDYRSKFTDPNFGMAVFLHCLQYHSPNCLDVFLTEEEMAKSQLDLEKVKASLEKIKNFEKDYERSPVLPRGLIDFLKPMRANPPSATWRAVLKNSVVN